MYERRLLTVEETCRELHISRPTLNELRRTGRIQTVRIGSRGVRVPVAEVDRYIAASGGDSDNLAPAKKRSVARTDNDVATW
jgi:excisionase family DNA binding protein